MLRTLCKGVEPEEKGFQHPTFQLEQISAELCIQPATMSTSMLRRQMKNLIQNFSEAEIKVREATSNDPWGPSSSLMSDISDLTYNVVACSEIMNMLWKRLNDQGKNWRHVYKALTLLEYLLKTGSDRVIQHCKENIYTVQILKEFQFIDRDGKDQGVNVREKAKQLVALVKDENKLQEERSHALKTKEKMAQAQATPPAPTGTPLRVGGLGGVSSGLASLGLGPQGPGAGFRTSGPGTSPGTNAAESKSTAEQDPAKSKEMEAGSKAPAAPPTATSMTATAATASESASELFGSSDPWDRPPPAPPADSDPWGGGGTTADASSDPWGDGSSAKNDPWGSTAASPPSGDPWNAPAAPASSTGTGAPTSDPWGGAGEAAPTAASNDPWGGDGGAAPTAASNDPWGDGGAAPTASTSDPWGGDGGAPATAATNDPWGDGGAQPTVSSTSDPWGGPAKDTTNGAVNQEPGGPTLSSGGGEGGAGSQTTLDTSSTATSFPARKTPESFLGASAALVDLDSLVSNKPKPKQSGPPMSSYPTSSPFMQSQGTCPVPGMAVSSGSTISKLGASHTPPASNPFGSTPSASISPHSSSLELSHFHTSPIPPNHTANLSPAMLAVDQIDMAVTAMRAQKPSQLGRTCMAVVVGGVYVAGQKQE
ncbi:hypothetical protein MATL_G00230580 [Megalops atlanticus]|uniref:ENTH domain-containing protein n=1 Tax=Megalops atlanticus TaxID=7932 RepID=A0A9D3T299_MEGAT|nr:hypothetical protein MATL_G00230580 [Megalops atlanticus]